MLFLAVPSCIHPIIVRLHSWVVRSLHVLCSPLVVTGVLRSYSRPVRGGLTVCVRRCCVDDHVASGFRVRGTDYALCRTTQV